jgi:hypothetical protein
MPSGAALKPNPCCDILKRRFNQSFSGQSSFRQGCLFRFSSVYPPLAAGDAGNEITPRSVSNTIGIRPLGVLSASSIACWPSTATPKFESD